MAVKKSALRNCRYCSYKKPDIKRLCYYCDNCNSEHYMERFRDDTTMQNCSGGNSRRKPK